MRLAWFCAAAVATSACFSPSLPQGQRCTESGDCPGDLECTPSGFCCSPGIDCAPPDDGGALDAAVDAREQTFTDHESIYSCDPNTEMLVHFDEAMPLRDECEKTALSVQTTATTVEAQFAEGLDFNRNGSNTELLIAPTDQLSEVENDYTIDIWVENPGAPAPGRVAVIVSAATFNATDIDNALFILGIDAERRVRLDLFGGAACQQLLEPPVLSVDTVGPIGSTHIRATVTATEAQLFINGYPQPPQAVTAPCRTLDATNVQLRFSGIRDLDAPMAFENDTYLRLEGVLDEFRLSRVDRVP